MPEDFDRLQGLIYDVEAKLYDIAESAKYAKDICIGLNRVFKEHFENDEYEISEDEFHKIICDAQRLAF